MLEELRKKGNELSIICNIYHFLNIFLSVSFPFAKLTPKVSEMIFGMEKRNIDTRENEILIFLAVIVIWKCRKSSSYLHSLSTIYLYSKLANALLFFRVKPIFGKLDVGRFPKEAEYFRINCSATSRQLPTFSCFKGGIQTERRPLISTNGKAIPFVFTEQNIILALDLTRIYAEYKKKLKNI
uniref:Uncharacterized protein n=1 Tax=Meloidogyne hapla TaxID=6305 RepID=A0A1I8BWB1_MELHA